MEIDGWQRALIERQPVARLATVDTQGQPYIVPIVYAFDGRRLFTPIDAKPKRVSGHHLQRVRNIQSDPRVAVVIDEYSDDWRELAWVQIRGLASLVEAGSELGPEYADAVRRLRERYPQYASLPLVAQPVIVITPQHLSSWRAMDYP